MLLNLISFEAPLFTYSEIAAGHAAQNPANGMFDGTMGNLTFYGHTNVTEIEFDVGQLGTALPAGYQWY